MTSVHEIFEQQVFMKFLKVFGKTKISFIEMNSEDY